jgi:undecaprenyl-diphosphatase
VALVFLLDWALASYGPAAWRLLKSLGSGIGRAVARDPVLSAWLEPHPRVDGFLRRRLTLSSWRGWYLTATSLVALWFLFGFVSIARDLATTSSIVAYDPQLSALVRAFRTPGVTRVLWIATVSGDTRVEVAVALVFVALLLMWGRRAEAVLVVVTIPLASGLGSVIKGVAAWARPPAEFMLISGPGQSSFPSGHALGSIVFYGLLAFVLLRIARPWRQRFVIVALAAFAAVMVAVSRVYLGVHWPSDIVASWFLGGAILTVAIGVFLMWERYAPRGPSPKPLWTPAARIALTSFAAVAVLAAVSGGAQADPLLNRVVAPPKPVARTSAGT